jgi:hypothetical protein
LNGVKHLNVLGFQASLAKVRVELMMNDKYFMLKKFLIINFDLDIVLFAIKELTRSTPDQRLHFKSTSYFDGS